MVVILLSGGLDSAVLAYRASASGQLGACVFVDYGQPAAEQERAAAVRIAAALDADLHICEVVLCGMADMRAESGKPGPRVVPGRNLVLIALGCNVATAIGADTVLIGCTRDDVEAYPDCRPQFVGNIDLAHRETGAGPRVVAPWMWSTRADVVKEARQLGVPVGRCASPDDADEYAYAVWSCYTPTDAGEPCGTCNSCLQETL